MFESPRCPACHGELPVDELVRRAPSTRNGIIGRVGLRCPQCQTELMLRQWRAVVATNVLLAALIFLLVGAIENLTSRNSGAVEALFIIGTLVTAYVWSKMDRWLLVHVTSFRPLAAGETLAFSLTQNMAAEAAQLKSEHEQQLRFEAERRAEPEVSGPWRCDQCGEENPQEFVSCWKCQASVPGHMLRAPKDDHD